LQVHLEHDLAVETGHSVMAWISGTGTYFLTADYASGRRSEFGRGMPAGLAGMDCREFAVDLELPAADVVSNPCASIGVCATSDWGIPGIATRTRTVVGTATIPILLAMAAERNGMTAFSYMVRVDSRAPERAVCAFVPLPVGGVGLPREVSVDALAIHAAAIMDSSRRITTEWIKASMGRVDALPHIDEATAYLKVGRWETHLGFLPPEVYFAPRYPTGPGTMFCERAYARALERARFVTGDASPSEVQTWCRDAMVGRPGPMLCACTVLGRMLCAFGLCIAYTPDVLLHPRDVGVALKAHRAETGEDVLVEQVRGVPGLYTEYVEQYSEPAQTMADDCDETSKYSLAACLAFQRDGPRFASPELRALAGVARAYVFSAVACLVPLSTGSTGTKEGSLAVDRAEIELDCTAHMTCIGIPRDEYFAALDGGAGPGRRGMPSIVVEGAGLSHPLLGPHTEYEDALWAASAAGSAVVSDDRHARWIAGAMGRLSDGGIPSKLVSTEFVARGRTAPYYRAFVHAFTWPVPGLLPDPPCRASFCTDGAIGAPWRAIVDPLGAGLRIMPFPPLPSEVLAASRLLLDHLPPPHSAYVHVAGEASTVWMPPAVPATIESAITTDSRPAPDPNSRSAQHIVLSIGLCDLPTELASMQDMVRRIVMAVDPDMLGYVTCIVNSVGVDRGELLLRIVVPG
jgi:hypothetical protein